MTRTESDFMQLLAYVYLQNARPDKAAVLLGALDAVAPGQARTLRALALAQVRSAKPQHALETLDRLAMSGGIDAAFHLLRAQALGLLARRTEAAAAMRTYLVMRDAAKASAH